MKLLIHLSLIALLISCSSTTIIKTDDSEVNIFVNGKLKGKGSAVHTDMKISWLSSTVLFQKEGCLDETQVFTKNEQVDVLPLVSGFILIFPFLWTMKYNAVHIYNYVCEAN